MDCEKCQELLSDFLDGALNRDEQARLNAHFEECRSCFTTHEELSSIVDFCRETRGEYAEPPNERALWLRIRNTIEAENARETAAAAAVATARSENWWTRWTNRSWELSLSQMAMAVSAIIIAVALATAVGLHRTQDNTAASTASLNNDSSASRSTSALVNLPVRGISQEIDYWQQRVDARKARWNQQRREDFDFNLKVINEALDERLKDLKENPHDEMTEEMLNAVLNNKVEFLREFADL